MIKRLALLLTVLGVITLASCSKDSGGDLPPPGESTEDSKDKWNIDNDPFIQVEGVALLDLNDRNNEQEDGNETGRNLYSAKYMLEVAGVPFFTTTDVEQAVNDSRMILCSSAIKTSTFSPEELAQLTVWVQGGGVIVAPACINPDQAVSELFGIASSSYQKNRYSASWDDKVMFDKEMEYMNEPEEKDFSLGNQNQGNAIKTYGYTLSTAESMATFNTGETAVSRNSVGNGQVYSFGLLWRDVIQRPQLNKDFSAQRSYSNDFEPSADMFPLFVRSVYAKSNAVVAWKSTIPDGYETVLIPTHDCDSRTAYDAMHYMSDYEKSIGLKSHYFMTTHYYRDSPYLSAFYDNNSIVQTRKVLADGHTIGSHSVGHFPDFNKTDRFPNTVVTREAYKATHDQTTGITTGGSTWAETVLSKMILEEDLGNTVRSFRSGHLLMNKNIPAALEDGGYSFSSCYGAGDVLTSFPYFERIGNEWTGKQSKVLQLPLHFSDVINEDQMNENNWHEKPERWMRIMNKLAGNYSPSMLLIHPNREWKMQSQKMLIDNMDKQRFGLYNFEDYGDFWVERSKLAFELGYISEKGKVIIRGTRADFARNPHLCFMIETSSQQEPSEVVLMDENFYSMPLKIKKVSEGKYMAYQ